MNSISRLQAFDDGRLPLKTPVTVFGKPGLITGRSFAHERYDVLFTDGTIQHSISREHLEINWQDIRS